MTTTRGLCECGCGEPTPIATDSNAPRGWVKGEPVRFVHNHHRRVPLKARFWSKVTRAAADECWLWTASTNVHGYGQITVSTHESGKRPQPLAAHRIAWELTNGQIPDGLSVLHRCDNPLCVNPAHLFLGTQKDNMRDAAVKGRIRGNYGPGMVRNL